MSETLPPQLAKLISDNPLEGRHSAAVEKLLAGDLEAGARAYRQTAAAYGKHGAWWRVWREIQRHRGISGAAMFEAMNREALSWFSRWSMEHGDPEEGLMAYPLYLAARGRFGPFPGEGVEFMRALVDRGRDDEALAILDKLSESGRTFADERAVAAQILAARGEFDAALAMVEPLVRENHDVGRYWAALAVVQALARRDDDARHSAAEAAKLDGHDDRTTASMLRALGISPEDWEHMRAPFLAPQFDFLTQKRLWLADPGAVLVPADGPTPHWFGDADGFVMPACPGCGHPMHQWFLLDLTAVSPLAAKLPHWAQFPMLGCVDCNVQLGRVDYEVDQSAMRVRVADHVGPFESDPNPAPQRPPLAKRFARLDAPAPRKDVTEEQLLDDNAPERPRVGGVPDWIQSPQRVFCHICRQEMTYVASMASPAEFDPTVVINNDGGYHYHFACDACRTISVIPQYT